jgi:DNA mismatch repair protein MutL
VAPADIDVNIHPTKTEIKFENEQSIWQILSAAVKDAIGKFCDVPTIDFDTEGRPDIPLFDPQHDSIEMPRVTYNPDYNPFSTGSSKSEIRPSRTVVPDWQQLYEGARKTDADEEQQEQLFPKDAFETSEHLLADKSPVHYQYKGRYIMTAVRSGLMIVDQHRADVRVRYEAYLEQMSQHQGNSQRLLFPEVLQFAPSEAVTLQRVMSELTDLGFDLSDLGGGSYAVAGVPAGLDGVDPVVLVTNIVADAVEQGTVDVSQLHATLAQSLARETAIPEGQVLSNDEMEHLINRLFACSNVNYTPDGRAILCILPQHDIEQLLG